MPLLVETIPLGLLAENCYLVQDPQTKRVLVVDPGAEPEKLIRRLEQQQLEPVAILLTHAHVDHIGAIGGLVARWPVPVHLNEGDWGLYRSSANRIDPWVPAAKGLPEPKPHAPVPGFDFQVIPTPGHTQGGVCFYFKAEGVLLSGDTMFQGTVGRTDLPGGSYDQLMDSIRNNLGVLPSETIVYPGHGPTTTIGAEMAVNRYF